jgi:hypothetical protein
MLLNRCTNCRILHRQTHRRQIIYSGKCLITVLGRIPRMVWPIIRRESYVDETEGVNESRGLYALRGKCYTCVPGQ